MVQYTCTSNFPSRQILDSQKSFPSGHTSMSVYSALFMMVITRTSSPFHRSGGSLTFVVVNLSYSFAVVLRASCPLAPLVFAKAVPPTLVGLFRHLHQSDTHHGSTPPLVGRLGWRHSGRWRLFCAGQSEFLTFHLDNFTLCHHSKLSLSLKSTDRSKKIQR